MWNYKLNKINNNYLSLKNSFNLLYFKYLLSNSPFIIYFNCSKISNQGLYNLKNEILKKKLKSYVINSKYIKNIFEESFNFFSSNIFFIFCNNTLNLAFVFNLLNNIKAFYIFNKCFSNSSSIIISSSLHFFHFIIFKLLLNLLIILLCYIINFIKSILCN